MDTDTISVDQLLGAANKFGDKSIIDKIIDLKDKFGLAGDSVIRFGDITKTVGTDASKALHQILEQTLELIKIFPSLGMITKDVFAETEDLVQKTAAAISKLGITASDAFVFLEPLIGIIDKNVTGIGNLGNTGYEAGSKITTAMKSIQPAIDAAFEGSPKAKKFFESLFEGTDRAIGLEREILAMSIAQGRASDAFDVTTHKLKDLNELYDNFVDVSRTAAINTNQSVSSIMELQKALSSIPGSLDSAEITKASQLAAAAGKDQLKVAEQLVEMYTRLGTSEHDALGAMAYIYDKAGDSKLRMEAFNKTVMDVAGGFKMLGDNTLATTNFVSAFDEAFKKSNISPEAMKEVISGIGQGIEKMDLAKEAFISGATGGPGGLAGAAQIQELMATGHMDEVIKKTMTAMQIQFGGPIVTRKDAASDPALAGEWFKQTQYLTQIAGIAKDEKDANRILEAMKSGVMDILKPGAAEGEKDTALSRQIARGTEIQDQTRQGVAGIFMNTLQTAELARIKAAQEDRQLMTGDPTKLFEKVKSLTGVDANQMLKGIGFDTGNRDRPQDNTTVRMLSHPGDSGFGQYVPHNWSEMLGGPLEKMDKITSSSMSRLAQGGASKDDRDVHRILESRIGPPPGTEAGITPVMRGHTPSLGLPETPKLTLPTAREGLGAAPGLGLPSVNITHTFKPIQLDISGIGDTVISRHVDLALVKSESNRVDQQVTGRPGGQ